MTYMRKIIVYLDVTRLYEEINILGPDSEREPAVKHLHPIFVDVFLLSHFIRISGSCLKQTEFWNEVPPHNTSQ